MDQVVLLGAIIALCLVAIIIMAFRGDKGSGSVAKSLTDTAQAVGALRERLTVIDQAQTNISNLTGQILTLQQVLSDKQSRGAFGEERLQAILDDQLAGLHEWQPTLSNDARPDCLIRLGAEAPPLVVDSKFPLEAYERLRLAKDEQERRAASASLKSDVLKHVRDIARKYLISGETQPIALMFIPSEGVFAELRASVPDVLHLARRERVVIVSPQIFMLAVNMIQALSRDAKMREHADKIRTAVNALTDDVKRLEKRVENLQSHFGAMQVDVSEIETSMRKISTNSSRIEAVDFDEDSSSATP